MADYHPLIARAVDGLGTSTGEARRSLYERARAALVAQLRGIDPPLSEADITRERLALEDAIRKVESETVRKLRAEVRPGAALRQPTARPPVAAAPAAPPPRRERLSPTGDAPAPNRPPPPQPELPRTEPQRTEPQRAEPQRAEPQRAEPRPAAAAPNPPPAETPAPATQPTARSRLLGALGGGRAAPPAQEGLKGFRDVVNKVDDLGTASAKAAQSARDTRASYGADSEAPQRRPEPQFNPEQSDFADDEAAVGTLEPADDLAEAEPQYARMHAPRAKDAEDQFEAPRRPRSYRGLVKLLVVLIIMAAVGGLISWQWSNINGLYHFVSRMHSRQAQTAPTPPAEPKFSGRVPQEQNPAQTPNAAAGSQSQPGPAVAQRVVLYEEDSNDPQGKRYVGSAVWKTDTVSPGTGLAPELEVRADITIPERNMSVTWTLRRNTDQALPASHTIEIMFNLPPDFPGGGIANVPGVLMKESEQARGVPLAGLAVKVTNGFFLIGLSAVDADVQRNIQLLKERPWFDIPIVYTNGGRAILAMEKGPPGDRAFADAFAAWGK